MKAIIHNESKLCIQAFDDSTEIHFLDDRILVGSDYVIGDLNVSNSTLVENVTLPADYFAGKYIYDSEQAEPWSVDENWVEPEE